MKWFKHDSDANRDRKLKKVIMRYGAEGYGLYWYCIELIAEPIDRNNLTFELEHDAEILAHDLKMDSKRVEEIMMFMVHLELFEMDGEWVTCMKLAQRIELSLVRSPQLKEIQRRLSKLETSRLLPNDSDTVGKVPKGSESSGKARNDSAPAPTNSCLDVDLDLDLDQYRTTATKKRGKSTPIPADFFPSPKTAQAIQDQGVTPEFIDDYLPRFIAYWDERGTRLHAWQALFIEQCVGRYRHERGGGDG